MEFVFQRIHPDDRERVRQIINHATREKTDVDFEYRLLRRDGSFKYLHVSARALDSSSGSLEFVGAVTDVTEAKQARAELEKAFEEIKGLKDRLQNENVALREEVAKASMFEEIVGTSPALQTVLSRISKVAPGDSSVLITGETGTGKELVARAIHKHSRRSSHAFVSVNCAAIPRDLIPSELFGHEKGAFTGATQRRIGRFELADGGTIFLDEVGELPLETQIALLRVLQEHEFERVGGTASIPTNVRLIAATNRDLDAAMAAATFRSDLYYRLNVFPIEMPALRERGEDIQLLVEYFINRFARKAGKRFEAVSKKSLDLLRSYPWPGNIRELQNVIERSVIICESDHFSIDESWLARRPSESGSKQQFEFSKTLAAREKEMIESVLRETKGRVFGPSGAAAKLGIPGTTLDSQDQVARNRQESLQNFLAEINSITQSSVVNVMGADSKGIPYRVGGVGFARVYLIVKCAVVVPVLGEYARIEQGVIERGIDNTTLVIAASFKGHTIQLLSPLAVKSQANLIEVPRGNLLFKICARLVDANKGSSHPNLDHLMSACDKLRVGAGRLRGNCTIGPVHSG